MGNGVNDAATAFHTGDYSRSGYEDADEQGTHAENNP
jgi:hypothetical protein